MSTASTRTLVLVCPHWAITASGGDGGAAVAVLEAQRVVATSPAARDLGVSPGQRRREAQARCPSLVVKVRDRAAELRAFEPVVAALETFGARVAVRGAGWAGFATRGPARYFGGELALARAVVAAVRVLPVFAGVFEQGEAGDGELVGPGCRVGIADGSFAATLAAWAGRVVSSSATSEFLGPLPIETLGDDELASLLRRLGITTLAMFGALGEPEVVARFGPDGAHAHRLARGLGESLPTVGPRALDRVVELELDPPAERVDAAAFVARGLAETLGERLSAAGLACTLLRVVVETTEHEHLSRLWSDDGPFSSSLVAERLRWQLEAWLTGSGFGSGDADVPRGIERIRLIAEEVAADRGRQDQLWGRSRAGSERAGRVLARVQGMLGAEGILLASLVGGRGPAERVLQAPFGDPPPREASVADLPWPGRLPAPNPSVVAGEEIFVELFDEDGAVVAVDARGMLSRAPAAVVLGGAVVRIASWAGPWPVDERWWERASRRRRARFQILLASGEAYLVALDHGRFLLEGRYD